MIKGTGLKPEGRYRKVSALFQRAGWLFILPVFAVFLAGGYFAAEFLTPKILNKNNQAISKIPRKNIAKPILPVFEPTTSPTVPKETLQNKTEPELEPVVPPFAPTKHKKAEKPEMQARAKATVSLKKSQQKISSQTSAKKPETQKTTKVRSENDRPKSVISKAAVPQNDRIQLEREINKSLKSAGIKGIAAVTGNNGEITLVGVVRTEKDRDKAVEISKSSCGGKHIRDLIFIVQ